MREQTGDLWKLIQPGDALVITTNGDVDKRGWAVMGRGIALQAARRFADEGLKERLGWMLQHGLGNHVSYVHTSAPFSLLTMPVKHHWHEKADPDLIIRSAHELVDVARGWAWGTIWLPRPGCGNGRLNWIDVRPLIEPILDDRFTVASR